MCVRHPVYVLFYCPLFANPRHFLKNFGLMKKNPNILINCLRHDTDTFWNITFRQNPKKMKKVKKSFEKSPLLKSKNSWDFTASIYKWFIIDVLWPQFSSLYKCNIPFTQMMFKQVSQLLAGNFTTGVT